jgi:uncharacterized membrane protein
MSATPDLDLYLRPHRSLPPAGFWIVIGIVATFSFVAGILFMHAGAWPVLGFTGLEVVLVWFAFRASYGQRRAYERIRLADGTLIVERSARRGASERLELPAYWLRVTLDTERDKRGEVVLSSHGRRHVVGAFLAPDQRATLAGQLSAALVRARQTPAAG